MAKISNTTVYPNIVPAAGDYLILTDVTDSDRTKTAKVSDFQDFFGTVSIETTLTSDQILNSFTQPVILIPGVPGFVILPISIVCKSTYGSIPYVFDSVGVNPAAYIALGATPLISQLSSIAAFALEYSNNASCIPIPVLGVGRAQYNSVGGGGNILFYSEGANPVDGDGTITFDIMYRLVTA